MSKREPAWIWEWNPEDEKFWESKGKFIARRNLIWSILAEHLGFTSAITACGGFLTPRGFGASIAATGGPNLALEVFLTFYVTCVAVTWWYYLRKSFLVRRARSLAEASV